MLFCLFCEQLYLDLDLLGEEIEINQQQQKKNQSLIFNIFCKIQYICVTALPIAN